jgi:uncharacterized protein (TIGR02453 family)
MEYFTEDFNQFFIELAANNHKDWFSDNRKRYEKSVKKPFDAFVAAALAEIQKHDPAVNIPAKDAIFRINRDIRFSKDKSLYKLNRTAILSSAGRKDHSIPGMYVLLGPEKVSFGGGSYFLKPEQLQLVREKIVQKPEAFMKVVKDKTFTKYYNGIQGDENKRLPKELKEAGDQHPILYKKQFYYMVDHGPELVTSNKLMDTLMEHYHAGRGVQEFLSDALA